MVFLVAALCRAFGLSVAVCDTVSRENVLVQRVYTHCALFIGVLLHNFRELVHRIVFVCTVLNMCVFLLWAALLYSLTTLNFTIRYVYYFYNKTWFDKYSIFNYNFFLCYR